MTTVAKRKRRAYAPRVPAEQRRTELLDAALHLVVTKGHNAATMDAVADQAGVTKPVVYGHFTSRAHLLAVLLSREQEQALEQLAQVLPADLDERLDADPSELISHILDEFLRAVQKAPDRWRCIVMSMPDMPAEFHIAREQARAVALDRAQGIAGWLLRTIDASPQLDPEIVAHTVVSLCEMAARLVLADPDHYRPDRFVAAVHAVIGLARRD